MEDWRTVWRKGFLPLLTKNHLTVLRTALQSNDDSLAQGIIVYPPPMMGVTDWCVESCCALSYCGWKGDGLETVGEVDEFFARMCFEIDKKLGEPAGCRWFLNWFDDAPREVMLKELLEEVELGLSLLEQK